MARKVIATKLDIPTYNGVVKLAAQQGATINAYLKGLLQSEVAKSK